MKLTQAAGRQAGAPAEVAPPRSSPGPLSDRVEQIEQNLKRIERVDRPAVAGSNSVDQKVLEAIIAALEARLAEHAGQVERRLADLDARLAIEIRSLDQQDHGLSRQIAEEIAALKEETRGLHREFGEAVARIVAEEVGTQVQAGAASIQQSMPARIALAVETALDARLASLRKESNETIATLVAEQVSSRMQAHAAAVERSMPTRIALAVETAVEPRIESARREFHDALASKVAEEVSLQAHAAVESRLPAAISASVAPLERQLRAEIAAKDVEIAELRQRLAEIDSNVLGMITGIGQICLQAAERLAPSATVESAAPQEGDAAVSSTGVPELAAQDDAGVPGFTQAQKPNRLWRVPMVSSILIASGGLLMRHFL